MADVGIEQLKEDIQADIKANDNQTITGDLLQERLIDTVDTLKGYTDDHVSVSQNTLSIGGTDVGELAGQLIENPEWVKVVTDSDNKILYGVKTDGKFYFGNGCPPQVQEYVQNIINGLSLDEYENIVTFLGDLIDGDSLATLLNGKLDAEGLDSDALETAQAVENPEYIQATTDSDDKILEGITPNGVKKINIPIEFPSAKVDYIENPEYSSVETDKNEKVLSARDKNGVKHEKVGFVSPFILTDSINKFNTLRKAIEQGVAGIIQVGENIVNGLKPIKPPYNLEDVRKNYKVVAPSPMFPFVKNVSIHRLYDDAVNPNMLFMCSQSEKHIFYSICPTDTKRAFGTVDPDYYNKYEANYFYYADKQNPSDIHKVVLPLTVGDYNMTARIKFVFEMSNGECLLEIENGEPITQGGSAAHNNLFVLKNVFSGEPLTEQDCIYSLTFDYYLEKISSFDNITEYKAGSIVLAPYGGGKTAKVYITHDYGASWDLIFCADSNNTHYIKPKAEHYGESNAYGIYPTSELLNPSGQVDWDATVNGNIHIHGIAYDRWYDRLWIVTGDGGAYQEHNVTGIWWTDDEGYTWNRIGGGMEIGTQLIGVIPMDHCVLFPTDGSGNGFFRWCRNGKDTIIEIEHCYNYAGVDGLVVYAGRTIQARNGFYLTTIAPENYNNPNWSNLGGVVATYNGFDFQKIYEDSFGAGTYETAEIGCCCGISDCGDKIILSAYYGGYIELDY